MKNDGYKNDQTKGKERHIPADETFPFAFVSRQVSAELPTRSQFSHYPDHNTGFSVNAKYVHCKQSQGEWPNHLYNLRPTEQHHLSWEAEGTHLRNGRFVSEEPAVLRKLEEKCVCVCLSLSLRFSRTHTLAADSQAVYIKLHASLTCKMGLQVMIIFLMDYFLH